MVHHSVQLPADPPARAPQLETSPNIRLVNSDSSPAAPVGETELLSFRRAPVSILLTAFWRLAFLSLVCIGSIVLVVLAIAPALAMRLALLSFVVAMVVLVWESVKRDAHRYCLTDRRLLWRFGVLRRVIVDLPLYQVQNILFSQSFLERLLAVGTIRASSASPSAPDVILRHVKRPVQVHLALRDAVARYPAPPRSSEPPQPSAAMPIAYHTPAPDHSRFMPVIGIVGGIGAGKSTVAAAFQRLGCYVIDSDVRAKEALDRPEVRDELVKWWGSEVLSPSGRIDRSKVASIIFAAPDERARLESLVHPIIRQDRARMIEEAARFWAKGVIVDAPLLFEAGVDNECDAVIFVDAPRDVRLARVTQTRAWSQAEFDRREASQLSLAEKQSRSQFTIRNAPGDNIDDQAARILSRLRAKVG